MFMSSTEARITGSQSEMSMRKHQVGLEYLSAIALKSVLTRIATF